MVQLPITGVNCVVRGPSFNGISVRLDYSTVLVDLQHLEFEGPGRMGKLAGLSKGEVSMAHASRAGWSFSEQSHADRGSIILICRSRWKMIGCGTLANLAGWSYWRLDLA